MHAGHTGTRVGGLTENNRHSTVETHKTTQKTGKMALNAAAAKLLRKEKSRGETDEIGPCEERKLRVVF